MNPRRARRAQPLPHAPDARVSHASRRKSGGALRVRFPGVALGWLLLQNVAGQETLKGISHPCCRTSTLHH
jgi:hypothetical protein